MHVGVYIFGSVVRVLLICYGIVHDNNPSLDVKFTDVDYTVFTGAARHITLGASPYREPTYKYTPLLALMLTPNVWLHGLFGKVLFCCCDLLVVCAMGALMRKLHPQCGEIVPAKLVTVFWILNPFTMTISSRGNAESVQVLLVLLTLLCVVDRRLVWGGIFYGLSVHYKLYPVIYALPLLLYIGQQQNAGPVSNHQTNRVKRLVQLIRQMLSFDCILFGVVSLLTFLCIGGAMYMSYGDEFIENTYLFHFRREDTQHNFSPYFFILRAAKDKPWLSALKTLAFIPQTLCVVLFGFGYHKQLPLACFLQTFSFVALNKVCTSQYFVWYIGLFPLALPYMSIALGRGCAMLCSWLLGQGVWLYFAYLLEFRKQDVVLHVWFASLFFLGVNLSLLYRFVKSGKEKNVEVAKRKEQ